MNFIHKIYIPLISILFSCEPSSKINTNEVQDIISKIKNHNENNEYDASFTCLKYLDSVYKNDVEVKKMYLELLRETNKYNFEYVIKTFSDSIVKMNDSIEMFVKNHNISKINDAERNESYYLMDFKNGKTNNEIDFSLKLNDDATFDILTNMMISHRLKGYNSISFSSKNDNWHSNLVEFDNPDNYTYELDDKYVETVRFAVSEIKKLQNVFANVSDVSINFHNKDDKLIKSKKLTSKEINGCRRLFEIHGLVAKKFYYQYKIDNVKKRLLKTI